MSDPADQRLDDLVVLRAATASRPLRVAELAAATVRFAPVGVDAAAWRARIQTIHDRLTGAGALVAGAPTEAATAAAWARLGTRGGAAWPRVVDRILPALALGIAADDARAHGRLADRDVWAAAITSRAIGLWDGTGAPPTLAEACDAIVWRRVGLAGTPKRTPPELRAHFIAQLFATPPAAGPPERLVRQYAALAVGAVRADLRLLRDALVRRWLADAAWGGNGVAVAPTAAPPAAATAPPTAAPPAAADGLEALARAVRAAAAAESRAVFDHRNVFISAVWRALRGRPPVDRLDLDGFKRELVAAHRAGLVSLARADLVAVMDPAELAASETASAEARYHFIVREDAGGN